MRKSVPDEYASRRYPVEENMPWQMKEWRWQSIGNVLLFMVIILALLGVFSDGVLSETKTGNRAGTLLVEHQRIMRALSDETFTVRMKSPANRPFELIVGRDFMEHYQIQTLQPQPQSSRTTSAGLVLTWPGQPDEQQTLWLGVQPQSAGSFTATFALQAEEPVSIKQWVLP